MTPLRVRHTRKAEGDDVCDETSRTLGTNGAVDHRVKRPHCAYPTGTPGKAVWEGHMYKHILLPTDGSDLSTRAVREGIRLAKSLGARVTALHATPQSKRSSMLGREMMQQARAYEQLVKEEAARVLAVDRKSVV